MRPAHARVFVMAAPRTRPRPLSGHCPLLIFLLVATTAATVPTSSSSSSAPSSPSEEDFAFEPEEGAPPPAPDGPLRRQWGVPDRLAVAGRLLQIDIPADAFSGAVDRYDAYGPSGRPLPSWLLFDKLRGQFEGVPSIEDAGEYYITVKALGQQPENTAKDVFSIEVIPSNVAAEAIAVDNSLPISPHHKVKCDRGEDPTFLTIALDVKYDSLKPSQRISAIKNLSGFLGLHHSLFHLEPHNTQEDLLSESIVLAGPGNLKQRSNRHSSAVRWQVGCEGQLRKHYSQLVNQLKQQAHDGTLAEVLQLPVIGWHVKTETSSSHRERREVGSGDYDDEDVPSGYDGDIESETDAIPEARIVPTMASPSFPEATASPHPHRHHHGEDADQLESEAELSSMLTSVAAGYNLPTSPVHSFTILPTPVLIPIRPTNLMSMEVLVEPSRVYEAEVVPSATPVFVTEVEPSSSPESPSTQVTEPLPTWSSSFGSNETSFTSSSINTSFSDTSSTSLASTTEEEPTPPLPAVTSEKAVPLPKPTDEDIEYGVKNIPPTIEHRLRKLPITAGKALRHIIPEDVFSDLEDGNTRNLRLMFKTLEGTLVPPTYWVQFDREKQEVYALPLEEQVSRWTFVIEAMDREGKTVSDNLEILVQHHKGRRTVNHEFTLHLRLEKKYEFPTAVDWQLRVLDTLAALYGDPDTSRVTVRNLTVTDPIIFTWTNDSLPRSHCPKDEIDRLYKRLTANEEGEPSKALRDLLAHDFIKVKKVSYRGIGQCEPPSKPDQPIVPPPSTTENFPPVPRNPIDHIEAVVGELLVVVVPEDSFYDPEEGNVRNMHLTLLTLELNKISSDNWLQFDTKNQEFYGIPMPGDEGSKEYHLVCEDKGGLTAHDVLTVEVKPARKINYNVEFRMKLDVPYNKFKSSASDKRKFIEKLRDLFGDNDASAIALSDIIEGSTIVTWHNRTLNTSVCPEDEIRKLRKILLNNDHSISDRVGMVLGPEFPVEEIEVIPAQICQGEFTLIHPIEEKVPPLEEAAVGSSDEYLITFIVPAVIIVGMILLAGIVACVLYRRRRRGKLSVGDEDERQTFRNKGIPVIFQDELEERPEPENKSPVIMKDEKPPLPPPEYQRSEAEPSAPPTAAHPLLGENNAATDDTPYQPPPPFTTSRDSGRQNRPKPTPTYRKPPPYVPP
ncbi:dystroglycan 1 isoform X2 [Schistocerca serialis cubense]|uniref:dystroglycan 1 isoform X2 n=1 Tax=Schistocerca serialis cubense TaxID=2023355 RepID=UPI00214E891D|nr:dystroglycan 1 isoform X2 [Schistocerca serialis cubense]